MPTPTGFKCALILMIGILTQGVMAETFKVINSNAPNYQQGYLLPNNAQIQLAPGEYLALAALNRNYTFHVEGPYQDIKVRKMAHKPHKPRLTDILVHMMTVMEQKQEEKRCEKDSLTGIIRCIIAPIVPQAETPTSKDKQLLKELWHFARQKLFPHIAPAPLSRGDYTHAQRIEMPTDPWLLVASWDENFCYRPNQPLTIWQPDSLEDKLVLFARSADQKPLKKGVDLDDVFVITLHSMPDDNAFPSKTYQAVWMAEKGCYRQAQLLLSPVNK